MDLVAIAGTAAAIVLFLFYLRRPRLWELEALDRLARENLAWRAYSDRIRERRAALKQAGPADREAAERELLAARQAAGQQLHAYLMWQRVPKDGWDPALADYRGLRDLSDDVGASLALDRAVMTTADLERRAAILRAFGRADLAEPDEAALRVRGAPIASA